MFSQLIISLFPIKLPQSHQLKLLILMNKQEDQQMIQQMKFVYQILCSNNLKYVKKNMMKRQKRFQKRTLSQISSQFSQIAILRNQILVNAKILKEKEQTISVLMQKLNSIKPKQIFKRQNTSVLQGLMIKIQPVINNFEKVMKIFSEKLKIINKHRESFMINMKGQLLKINNQLNNIKNNLPLINQKSNYDESIGRKVKDLEIFLNKTKNEINCFKKMQNTKYTNDPRYPQYFRKTRKSIFYRNQTQNVMPQAKPELFDESHFSINCRRILHTLRQMKQKFPVAIQIDKTGCVRKKNTKDYIKDHQSNFFSLNKGELEILLQKGLVMI